MLVSAYTTEKFCRNATLTKVDLRHFYLSQARCDFNGNLQLLLIKDFFFILFLLYFSFLLCFRLFRSGYNNLLRR